MVLANGAYTDDSAYSHTSAGRFNMKTYADNITLK